VLADDPRVGAVIAGIDPATAAFSLASSEALIECVEACCRELEHPPATGAVFSPAAIHGVGRWQLPPRRWAMV